MVDCLAMIHNGVADAVAALSKSQTRIESDIVMFSIALVVPSTKVTNVPSAKHSTGVQVNVVGL